MTIAKSAAFKENLDLKKGNFKMGFLVSYELWNFFLSKNSQNLYNPYYAKYVGVESSSRCLACRGFRAAENWAHYSFNYYNTTLYATTPTNEMTGLLILYTIVTWYVQGV